MKMIRGIVISVAEGLIKLFSASGRTGESFESREYFQHYGFTSRPLEGAELIIIREGNHIVAVASDDRRYRIAIADGEVALYDDLGQYVHLKRDMIDAYSPAKIKATAPLIEMIASTKVIMTTPVLEVSGNITAGGNMVATGNVSAGGNVSDSSRTMAAERTIYNAHTHPNGGVPSGQM